MANELKHGDQGCSLTKAEFEGVGLHVFNSQATGDLPYAVSSSQISRLGIGSSNALLEVASGIPGWTTSPTIGSTSWANANHAHAACNSGGTIAITATTGTLAVGSGGTGATTFTDGGVLLGSGSGAITALAVLTDGQVIVGDGSGDPVAESGATLRTSIGVGTGDTLSISGLTLSTDLSVANGGTGASTFTDGGVLLGSGTSAITALAVLTDGQMIVGDGSGDPVAESGATLRTSIGVGTGDTLSISGLTLSTDLSVANGGTGASSLTANGVLIGNGTSAFTSVDMSTKGHVLIGDGSGNPRMLAVGCNAQVLTACSGETTGVKWAAAGSGAKIYTGTYTGDDTTSQGITGVGFAPKYVELWQSKSTASTIASRGHVKTTDVTVDNNPAGMAINISDTANVEPTAVDMITSLDADGFTVDDAGTNDQPNTGSTVYEFWCIG